MYGEIPGGPSHSILDAVLTGDGRWLVAAEPRGMLDLWEANSLGLDVVPAVLARQPGEMVAADVSLDGWWVAATSGDNKIQVWDRSSGDSPVIITAEDPAVSTLVFSPDGRRLIAAGREQAPEIWDLSMGTPTRLQRALRCAGSPNASWELSPRRRWLAVACDDGTVLARSLTLGEHAAARGEVLQLKRGENQVSALAFSASEDRLATGDLDGNVCLWRLSSAGQPMGCAALPEPVTFLALSPDRRLLAAVGEGGSTFLERLDEEGAPTDSPLSLSSAAAAELAWSPDGRWLATWTEDSLALQDLRSLGSTAVLDYLKNPPEKITGVAFSPDGGWLAAAGAGGTAWLWNLKAGATAANRIALRGHETAINTLAFSADSAWLVTREEEGPFRLWDLDVTEPGSGPEPLVLAGHQGPVYALTASAEGSGLLISAGEDGRVLLWKDPASRMRSPGHLAPTGREAYGPIRSLTVPAGRRLVTFGDDGVARLWDLAEPPRSARAESRATSLATSPDGRWAALSEESGFILLWDLATSAPNTQRRAEVRLAPGEKVVAVSPGANWLLVSATNGHVILWDRKILPSRKTPLPSTEGGVAVAAFSPDGRWLITGDSGGAAYLWDLDKSRKLARQGYGPELAGRVVQCRGAISAVAFAVDSRRIAIGSETGEVAQSTLDEQGWGKDAAPFPAHDGPVTALAFSPDGRWLATAATDRKARLWDLSSETLVTTSVALVGHADAVLAVTFEPSGRWLFTAGADGTIRRWRLRREDLVDLACRLAGRNLTREEWRQYLGGEPYRKTCPDFPEGR